MEKTNTNNKRFNLEKAMVKYHIKAIQEEIKALTFGIIEIEVDEEAVMDLEIELEKYMEKLQETKELNLLKLRGE